MFLCVCLNTCCNMPELVALVMVEVVKVLGVGFK